MHPLDTLNIDDMLNEKEINYEKNYNFYNVDSDNSNRRYDL